MMTILKELMQQSTPKKERNGRLIFMALLPEIKEALTAGYLVIDIHRLLIQQGKISIHYSTFNTYVKKYIHKEKMPQYEIRTRHGSIEDSENKPTESVIKTTDGNNEAIQQTGRKSEKPGLNLNPDTNSSGIKELLK
jgi:hypothetical protein